MSSVNYRPDIDGLRAVAVLAVVIHHLSAEVLPGGYIGVDIFFVISGYLITKIIYNETTNNTFSFVNFYERRARRILPALSVVLIVTLGVGYVLLLPTDFLSTLKAALSTVLFSSNVFFWREMAQGYFAATDMAQGYFAATDSAINPLLHTWSLGVEEQFYIFFPFLLLFTVKYLKRYMYLVFIIVAICSLVLAEFFIDNKSVAVFFLSPFRVWELMAGSLLATMPLKAMKNRVLGNVLGVLSLIAILVPAFLYDGKTAFPGVTAIPVIIGTTMLIYLGLNGQRFLINRLLSIKPLLFVGLISYSLYLWHWPLIVFYNYHTGFDQHTPLVLSVLFAVSIILAVLSYQFIERPFRNKTFFTRALIFKSSLAVSVLLIVISTAGVLLKGIESRFSDEVVQLEKNRSVDVPFSECEKRTIKETDKWCRIGSTDEKETIVLWGDSHMLAWVPVLDSIFKEQNKSAILAYLSSCPPLLNVHVHDKLQAQCYVKNQAVKKLIQENKNLDTVLMSAYWGAYFKDKGPLSSEVSSISALVAHAGIKDTADFLKGTKHIYQNIMLGPVPTYEKDVPLTLAIGLATNRDLLSSNFKLQMERHQLFFKAFEDANVDNSLYLINPIEELCDGEQCLLRNGLTLFYRDSHHLSVKGSMYFKDLLTEEIMNAPLRYVNKQ